MSRIVLTTFGSYGDLLPYLALAKGMLARGHDVVVATSECYRSATESVGAEFAPVRPDIDYEDFTTMRRVIDQYRGAEFLVRDLLAPMVRDMYEDLDPVCEGADLLVSHVLTFAAPIIGEQRGMQWMSSVLSPMVLCSAHDPPALAPIPWFASLRFLGPRVLGLLWRGMKRTAWSWSRPIRELRTEFGLPADQDPLWEGQHSPHGVLVLFSEEIASPQPDWPEGAVQCGFPRFAGDFGGEPDAERLGAFLADGDAPIVISLGSSASHAAEGLFETAAAAVTRVGRRGVLVMGGAPVPASLPADVIAIGSTDVEALFAAGTLSVHAGGIGTTGQAMRSGKPQLVIPFAHDQFDNARRVVGRGIGGTISRRRLRAERLAAAMKGLLRDDGARAAADAVGRRVRAEDGVGAACAAMERVLDAAR